MLKKIAVIFDLDGTILDTLKDIYESVNLTLEEFNYPKRSFEEIKDFVGNGNKMLIKRALPNDVLFEENEIMKVYDRFVENYNKNMLNNTKPYPEIISLFKELQKTNVVMGIVSNKYQAGVDVLNEMFFKDYIDVALGNRDNLRPKPYPDLVELALKLLNINKENDVIYYVGDSEVDVETARNSKLIAISVTWGFKTKEFLLEHKPDYIVDKVSDLLKILKK